MEVTIHIKSIPHSEHRKAAGDTVGDWWWEDSDMLQVRVSHLSHTKFEMLVAHHETIEALLCRASGRSQASVDAFDRMYEGAGEAGDDPQAPYHLQHVIASICERAIAHCLCINWNEYEKELDSLG